MHLAGGVKIYSPKETKKFSESQAHGFVHVEKEGVWLKSACFEGLQNANVKEFLVQCSELRGKTYSYKVIGPKTFCDLVQSSLSSYQWQILKAVEREQPFALQFDSSTGRLQVSKAAELSQEPAQSTPAKKVKVLIVDDSKTIRMLLRQILSADPKVEVIGDIEDPLLVEGFIQTQRPDVMTLDIHMPHKDGVTLLRELTPKYKIPTVMISSISREEGPQVLTALSIGAVDYIQKPSMKDLDIVAPLIIESVKTAALAKVQNRKEVKKVKAVAQGPFHQSSLVVIGSSTGGTEALRQVFESMPDEIPAIVCVQHIPAVFSKALADRLNQICKFEVKEAQDQDEVRKNRVLIAPGGKQLKLIEKSGKLFTQITDDEPVNRHKPSVDYMFHSVVDLKLAHVVGVVLTGMGADGARGLRALRDQGARTIAQDKESSVVYGMPREAFERGGAEFVEPLDHVAAKILELCSISQRVAKVS